MTQEDQAELMRLRRTGDRTDKMAATFMLAGYERDVAMQMAQAWKEAFAPFVTSDHEFDQACLTVEQCHLSGRLGTEEFQSLSGILARPRKEPALVRAWRWAEGWAVWACLAPVRIVREALQRMRG